MTKPRNFPGRVQARRERALARLVARQRVIGAPADNTELETLHSRVAAGVYSAAKETKKRRGGLT